MKKVLNSKKLSYITRSCMILLTTVLIILFFCIMSVSYTHLSIKGSWNSFGKPFPGSDWTGAVDLYENHGMTAKDIISHRLSLDEAPAMFEKIATEKFFFSKIMFYPNGQE